MTNFLFSIKKSLFLILWVYIFSFSIGAEKSIGINFEVFAEEKNINIPGRILMFKGYRGDLYFLNESEGNIWRLDQNLKLLNKIGKKERDPERYLISPTLISWMIGFMFFLGANY